MSRQRATFRSLRSSRNFRLFFAGQVVSASGTWMQKIGQAWLVLDLTDSGALLGAVAALQQLPTLLLGPWGGLLADRIDKRRLLLVTQVVSAVLALLLGVLTVSGHITFARVAILALLLGVTDALDRPARFSFIGEMVGASQLLNAVALNSVVMNSSKLIGPAAAGLLIGAVGVGPSFLVNATSYLAMIVALLCMRPQELELIEPEVKRAGQLREGFAHVRGTIGIAAPLFLMTAAGLLAYEWQTTLPLLARDAFGGGAPTFGAMFSAMGLGAVLGGLGTAGTGHASGNRLALSTAFFSTMLLATAAAPTLLMAMAALVFVGAGSSMIRAQATTLMQHYAAPQMRGRVMALVGVATAGTTPISGPLLGTIGEVFGGRAAFAFGGAGTALATLFVMRRLRPLSSTSPATLSPVDDLATDAGAFPPSGA